MATVGSSFNPKRNIGEKKTAPPIPVDMAMVATKIEMGKRNQLSNESIIVACSELNDGGRHSGSGTQNFRGRQGAT